MEAVEKICPVCKDVMSISVVGVCEHAICYICSTRLRVICEQTTCSICRTDMPQVFYIRQNRSFATLRNMASNFLRDSKYNILFESESVQLNFMQLLEHRCSVCNNLKPFNTFKLLHDHMKKDHNLHYCEICLQHLKLFPSERKFYTREDLGKHKRIGDVDDYAYRGHPLCEFCDRRYLDPDELARHLRKEHYFCQFCDADGRDSNVVFGDYSYLRLHFLRQHFLCEEGDCANVHFTNAFRTEIDLKAHTIAAHGKSMRRTEAKQVRTIEVDYGSVRQTSRGERLWTADARRTARYNRHEQSDDRRRNHNQNRTAHAKAYESEDADVYRAVKQSMAEAQAQLTPQDEQRTEDVSGPEAGAMARTQPRKKESTSDTAVPPPTKTDFPALSREASSRVTPSASSSVASANSVKSASANMTRTQTEPSLQSMAKRFAIGSGHSVAEGSLVGDEFPSLSSGKSSSGLGKPEKQANRWRARDLTSQQQTVDDVVDDFPSLSMKSKQKKKPVPASDGAVPKVRHNQEQHSDTKWSVVINDKNNMRSMKSVAENRTVSQNGTKAEQGRSREAKFTEIERLQPSMAVSSPRDGSYSSENASATPFSELATVRLQPSATTSDSQTSSSNPTKSKKKNKSFVDSTVDSRSTRKDINGVVEKEDDNTLSGNHAGKGKSKNDNKQQKTASDKLVSETAKQQAVKSTESSAAVAKSDFTLKGNDNSQASNNTNADNPLASLFLGSKISTLPSGTSLDNAVATSSTSSTSVSLVAPPPGFSLPLSVTLFPTRTPPGLQPPPPPGIVPPPPGFQQVNVESTSGKNPSTEPHCTYMPPAKVDLRNRELITKIQASGQQNFDEFKTLSGKFRKGEIDATLYYDNCKRLLGEALFTEVFTELLVLLPDIDRQNALLAVHRKATAGNKRNVQAVWKTVSANIVTCGVCSQVLLSQDVDNHRTSHRKDMDFPPLA